MGNLGALDAPAAPPAAPPAIPTASSGSGCDCLAGLWLTGELFYLRPNRDGLGVAVTSTTSGGTTSSSLEELSLGGTTAFRVGAAYLVPDSAVDLGATFTYFRADTQRIITAPDGGSLLGTLATDRDARDATAADAGAALSYAVLDLDAGTSVRVSDSLCLRAFGGVRLASIDQSLKAIYSGGSLGAGTDYVNSPVRYRGAGLTFGGEASCAVWQGWGFYGRARFGLLSGRFDSRFSETVGGSLVNDQSERFFTVTPFGELGAGLSYQGERLSFRVGYEVTDYVNFVNGIGGPGPGGAFGSRRRSDLNFEALGVRLGYSF
jgi:hypothetical protein